MTAVPKRHTEATSVTSFLFRVVWPQQGEQVENQRAENPLGSDVICTHRHGYIPPVQLYDERRLFRLMDERKNVIERGT